MVVRNGRRVEELGGLELWSSRFVDGEAEGPGVKSVAGGGRSGRRRKRTLASASSAPPSRSQLPKLELSEFLGNTAVCELDLNFLRKKVSEIILLVGNICLYMLQNVVLIY